MSKMQALKGVMKTFLWLLGEEWNSMDHKLIRVVGGAIGFVMMALFWYFFLRNFLPF
jgi:hypothetical protein